MDASNLLKPTLARGELHCIGATTLDEYKKHIEKDAALERRFQPVMVDQPTVEDTISILRGLRERYEIHHGVRIKDAALVAAAVLSAPLHHRPVPARQGHRPRGRGGGPAADRDRLDAGRARRDHPPDPAARDRARGPAEGDRRRLPRPAGEARGGAGAPAGQGHDPARAVGAREGGHRAAAAAPQAHRGGEARDRQGDARLRPEPRGRAAVRDLGRARARAEGAGGPGPERRAGGGSSRRRWTRRTSPRSSPGGRASRCRS